MMNRIKRWFFRVTRFFWKRKKVRITGATYVSPGYFEQKAEHDWENFGFVDDNGISIRKEETMSVRDWAFQNFEKPDFSKFEDLPLQVEVYSKENGEIELTAVYKIQSREVVRLIEKGEK